jgi:hypothetical protein
MALRSYIHTSFDPRRIPGLHSWWDAADSASVTLDSGRVSQLSDKSGNARHLTNTTSGSTQPSYVTAGRNGLNVARFAAASVQRLSVPSSTATYKFLHDGTPLWWISANTFGTVSDPATIYALFANQTGTSSQVGTTFFFDDRSGVGNNAANYGVFTGSGASVNTVSGSSIIASYQNILTPNSILVSEALVDAGNATASSRLLLRVNGGSGISANTSTASPSTASAFGNFTVGSTSDFNGPLQGDICELMFFSQQPTAAARDLIRRYLGAKWGVAVA